MVSERALGHLFDRDPPPHRGVAAAVGVSEATLGAWKAGRLPIPADRLPELLAALIFRDSSGSSPLFLVAVWEASGAPTWFTTELQALPVFTTRLLTDRLVCAFEEEGIAAAPVTASLAQIAIAQRQSGVADLVYVATEASASELSSRPLSPSS